ncbi:MAG: TetR/AcrR family transcriptional regulator [Bacilli bacterium]|nr:TetR/AcrR family transcriptional regulator [Bacilli bacterium]
MKKNDKIFKSSFKLINDYGLENFSMRKLANELGCQPAAIYYYYHSKDDLLNDLYISIYNKYFLVKDQEFNSLEEHLYDLYERVLKHRDEYIFLIHNFKASFLYSDSIKQLMKYNRLEFDKIQTYLEKDFNIYDFLIINSSLYYLATSFDKQYELIKKRNKDFDLKKYVKKIVNAVKED